MPTIVETAVIEMVALREIERQPSSFALGCFDLISIMMEFELALNCSSNHIRLPLVIPSSAEQKAHLDQ